MMGVDPTNAAEVVLGNPCIPLIQAELVLAANNTKSIQGDSSHQSAFAAANGAVAASYVLVAVDQVNLERDSFAVACACNGVHRSLNCGLTPELTRAAKRHRVE